MEEKYCYTCKTLKPISAFYKSKKTECGVIVPCKVCFREKTRKYVKHNKEKTREATRKWTEINKDKIVRNYKEKYENDKSFRNLNLTRSKLYRLLRYETNTSQGEQFLMNTLGCSKEFFKNRLISLGYTSGDHIDHIIPLNVFDMTNKDHIKIGFHYLNTQPLSREDNCRKSNKLIDGWEEKLAEIGSVVGINYNDMISHIKKGKTIKDKYGKHFLKQSVEDYDIDVDIIEEIYKKSDNPKDFYRQLESYILIRKNH